MVARRLTEMVRDAWAPAGLPLASLLPFVLMVGGLLLASCGGGGGGHDDLFTVSGSLSAAPPPTARVTLRAAEIAGATVAVEGTEDSAQTDAAGNFELTTSTPDGSLVLLVTGSTFAASYALESIPPTARDAVVALEYDSSTGLLTAASLAYLDGNGNVLDPNGSPGEEPTAAPEPTTAPGQPTATAAPSQPTAAPTSVSSQTPAAATPTPARPNPTVAADTPTPKPTVKPTTSTGGGSATGKAAFQKSCSGCHSASQLRGKTAAEITAAGMAMYAGNSLNAIVAYLRNPS